MARANLYTNMAEDKNYLGELFLVGAYQTPFLNMAGGIDGGRAKVSASFEFPVAQPWNLRSASQPAISEADSVAGKDVTTVGRSQEFNTAQIFQEAVQVSYAKQSTYGAIDGVQSIQTTAGQPVTDEMAFQKMAHLRQIAFDADFSFLQGAYAAAANSATAGKTRGIIAAVEDIGATVSGGNKVLTKRVLDNAVREMAEAGAVFENPVLFCNAYNKQRISNIFGYAPESRSVGGVNIEQIYTDFSLIGVVWAPNMPNDKVLIADMNYVFPVFVPVPEKGLIFYEELAKVGASEKGQFYGQLGLDYGPKEYHGIIKELATS